MAAIEVCRTAAHRGHIENALIMCAAGAQQLRHLRLVAVAVELRLRARSFGEAS
jgi:hypothetical protein